eukprot:31475-Pelagococcus_subviridis.AAC.12
MHVVPFEARRVALEVRKLRREERFAREVAAGIGGGARPEPRRRRLARRRGEKDEARLHARDGREDVSVRALQRAARDDDVAGWRRGRVRSVGAAAAAAADADARARLERDRVRDGSQPRRAVRLRQAFASGHLRLALRGVMVVAFDEDGRGAARVARRERVAKRGGERAGDGRWGRRQAMVGLGTTRRDGDESRRRRRESAFSNSGEAARTSCPRRRRP